MSIPEEIPEEIPDIPGRPWDDEEDDMELIKNDYGYYAFHEG